MVKYILFGGAVIETVKANFGLAVLRVFAGLSLAFGHGLGKLPPSAEFIEGTAKMGFPLPGVFAWAAGFSEFGGGLLLALGLFTRPASFFVCCTMCVAAFIRHAPDPFRQKEMALLYLSIALAFALIGAGRYGVDRLIRPRTGISSR